MGYIERDLGEKIRRYLSFKEMLAIIGPRQAGKTTLINKCLDEIKEKKKINRISFEDIRVLREFEEDIESFILEYVEGYDILFIDEVQYSKNSGQKLKYIYDSKPNLKVIISGSSATELSLQSIKYLVGRIFVFELQTFSFNEFLRYRDKRLYSVYKKGEFKSVVLEKLNSYVFEYMRFGGYPRVILMDDVEDKKNILNNIFNTYMLKEIGEILQFKESHYLDKLLQVLASQIGGIINYNDLTAKTGIKYKDLKNDLSILEKTFITSYALNFHTNKQSELVKSPKIYFYDFGMRNVILNNFELTNLSDLGGLYENFIYMELLRCGDDVVKFWRTKTKAEVDLIVEKSGKFIPIEVKSNINSNVVEKSFRSFIKRYNPEKGYILSLDYQNERIVGDCDISFLPFVKFLSSLI